MSQHTELWDWALTDADIDLTTEFMMELAEHEKEYWSSDDFRHFGLDSGFKDPQHQVGAYFAKLKANGVAVPYGEVPSQIASNNRRKNDLWSWNWSRWRVIVRSRLP